MSSGTVQPPALSSSCNSNLLREMRSRQNVLHLSGKYLLQPLPLPLLLPLPTATTVHCSATSSIPWGRLSSASYRDGGSDEGAAVFVLAVRYSDAVVLHATGAVSRLAIAHIVEAPPPLSWEPYHCSGQVRSELLFFRRIAQSLTHA
jgi:hypothetical protein